MKNIHAWGFLVSCNQYLDYRTVVAPNFMCQAGASSILARTAGGDLTEKGSALYREIHNSKADDLTLVFRVIEATAEDTGIAGNGVLKDPFGREIYLIEGIVLQGTMLDVVVTQDDLEKTHKQLVEYYREFWECSIPNPAIPAEPFTLEENSYDDCLKYQKLKPYTVEANQAQTRQELSIAISNSQNLVSSRDSTLDPAPNLLQKILGELWSYFFERSRH